MTAEHPSPSQLFPISTFTTMRGFVTDQATQIEYGNDLTPVDAISKKRKRLLLEEEDTLNILPPIEKSPRRDNYQVEICEENQTALVDISKMDHKEILSAYKRIWDNLDMSKPADAKLEPFVWQKIREYQRNK